MTQLWGVSGAESAPVGPHGRPQLLIEFGLPGIGRVRYWREGAMPLPPRKVCVAIDVVLERRAEAMGKRLPRPSRSRVVSRVLAVIERKE